MELQVSAGSGGNPNKIMFYMGMMFVVLGLIIGGGWVAMAIAIGEPLFSLGGILFLGVFCGVGGLFAYIGKSHLNEGKEVLEDGVEYLGKIFAYEPDYRVTMNGAPCITLVVRYLRNGDVCEARVNTGDSNQTRFPIGATVGIKLLNGVAAMVPNSICDLVLEDEESLMDPDFDPRVSASSINVECPNCAANVVVPLGRSRFCPYCDTKISLDSKGALKLAR